MNRLSALHIFCAGLLWAAAAGANAPGANVPADSDAVRGRVENSRGVAVEHAHVLDTASRREAYTDREGRFEVLCELPCTLVVTHPRYVDTPWTVTANDDTADAKEVTLQLKAKQEVYEEIVITASRGGEADAPVTIVSNVVHVEDKAAAPSTLVELVEGIPGVAENGQAGIFQTFSIRGVAGQRVMTLVDGMRIAGERRAGTSTSFLDPLLMGSVDVLRGPASTDYGSGALGGVVQVFPRVFDGFSLAAGFSSFGDETYEVVGWGDKNWSLGIAHRTRTNDASASGEELNDHFTQVSATVSRRWQTGARVWELLFIPSFGDDIGKSNTDFPERTTNYPREEHLLFKLGVTSENGWRFHAWAHPNELTTETVDARDPGDLAVGTVENDAFDIGAGFVRDVRLGDGISGRWGLDWIGRRGVEAVETEGATTSQTLDGEEDELAAFGSLSWNWGDATVQVGGRFTWQQQENVGSERVRDDALTGFVGLVRPLGKGWELVLGAGTGLRFPNLSERYFTGLTGRGQVIGNPDLEPESSVNVDAGLRFFGSRVYWSSQVFRLEVDDYVERVDLDPSGDVRTFVNLTSGRVTGLEVDGFYEIDDRWRLLWSGHLLDGEAEGGRPLADVPGDRVQLGLRFKDGAWEGRLTYQLRLEKDEPGSGEKPIGEAHLVHLALDYRVSDALRVTVRGRNLLDEIFFSSADRRSPVAPGRSVGVGLVWTR